MIHVFNIHVHVDNNLALDQLFEDFELGKPDLIVDDDTCFKSQVPLLTVVWPSTS